jgi:hypothetical protein
LAVIFGMLPLVLTLPGWLVNGYRWDEVMLAGTETLLWQFLVIAFALPLAALTAGLVRFLMATLVFVVAFAVAILPLIALSKGAEPWIDPRQELAIRLLAAIVVVLIGGNLAAIQQFVGRQLRRAYLTVAAGSLIALVVFEIFHWRFALPGKVARAVPNSERADQVKLIYRNANAWQSNDHAGISVNFEVTGVPPELVWQAERAEQDWRWSDGFVMKRTSLFPSWDVSGGAFGKDTQIAEWIALRLDVSKIYSTVDARRGEWLERTGVRLEARPQLSLKFFQADVPQVMVNRVRQEPPAYLMRGNFQFLRPIVVGEGPVQPSGTFTRGFAGISVVHADHFFFHPEFRLKPDAPLVISASLVDELSVIVVEHLAAAFKDLSRVLDIGSDRSGSPSDPVEYYLINRARGTGVPAAMGFSPRTYVATVQMSRCFLAFCPPAVFDGEDKWVTEPGWFEGATLAKLEFRQEELFTKEVRVDRFELLPETDGGKR